MVKESNQARGDRIAAELRRWIADRDAEGDYLEWISTTGKKAGRGVKRKKLAEHLGVSTSTLNNNSAANDLKNAEYRWSSQYASQKSLDSKAAIAETDRAKASEKRAKIKASRLEGDNTALKAENRLLRARLRKYESVEEMLMNTARAPRPGLQEL